MDIIEQLDKEQVEVLAEQRPVPEFSQGDTVKVWVKVREGEKQRLQAYEGVVIARAGKGLNQNFTVRKISYGEGVERVFPLYSPNIDRIEILRRGRVRRAKLYYLRDRRGKAARIFENTNIRTRRIRDGERALAAEARATREREREESAKALAAEREAEARAAEESNGA